MNIIFEDRFGNKEYLDCFDGESVESVLLRNYIPVYSVITTKDNIPISEKIIPQNGDDIIVKLIEGYDIKTINESLCGTELTGYIPAYLKRRLLFTVEGELDYEEEEMEYSDVADLVDETIEFTVEHYNLIEKGDRVLVGLSGGVDSSSLVISLSKLSKKIGFDIVTATFEDYDNGENSTTLKNAKEIANKFSLEHHVIPADTITNVFNLRKPIRQIFPEMMNGKYRDMVMYADHHTTRRALEVYSEKIGANKIVLGLHTTDLIAGLLNSYTTGYYLSNIFKRKIGQYTYIYPLAYVPKKELHMYFYKMMGRYANHSYPNAWESNPKDRNYYYYLADHLQTYFPGIEHYLFSAHDWSLRRKESLKFTICKNCGSHVLQQPFAPVNEDYCDVCAALIDLKYLKENRND